MTDRDGSGGRTSARPLPSTCDSAGLALPFLLTALGIGPFLSFYKRFRSYLHAVEVFSGALPLFVAALIFMNKLTWLSGKLWFLNRFSL